MKPIRLKLTQWFPWIFSSIGALFLFVPTLITGKVLYWGTISLQFTPWRNLAWQEIQMGSPPLWNPYSGMGAPLMANYQTAFFYPPNWLLALLAAGFSTAGIAWGETLLVMLHIIWAGWGMVYLVRAMGGHSFAQAVSGMAFSLSGYVVARSSFLSINSAVAWMPWLIAFTFLCARSTDQKRLKYRIFLILCMAMQLLSGHAQTTWYTFLLSGGLSFFWGWKNARWNGALRQAAGFIFCGMVACFISAIQLLPTAEYLLNSQRADQVDFDYAMNYSFWPWRILTILVPNLFGTPGQGNYWVTADAYWEDAIYVGLIPFILSFKTIISQPRHSPKGKPNLPLEDRSLMVLLWVILGVSLLLALGRYTPIFPFLYRFVPTFNMFQAPTRFSIWYVWGISLLAAVGAERWSRPVGQEIKRANYFIVAALGVLLSAGIAYLFLRSKIQITYLTGLASSGLVFFLFALLNKTIPYLPDGPAIKPWHWVAALVILGDLIYADYGLNPSLDLQTFLEKDSAIQQMMNRGTRRIYLSSSDEQALKFQKYFQFDNFNNQEDMSDFIHTLLPNENIQFSIEMVNNFDPMVPGRYTTWMSELESSSGLKKEKMLQLMDVSEIERLDGLFPLQIRFEPFTRIGNTYWTDCVAYAKDEHDSWKKTLSLLSQNDSESAMQTSGVILEATGEDSCPTPNQSPEVNLISRNSSNAVYSIESHLDGWVVFSQTYYPGWKVKIDGLDSTLERANYLFSAVKVPVGDHIITIYYDPISFKIGAIISLSTIVLFALVVGLIYSRRKASIRSSI